MLVPCVCIDGRILNSKVATIPTFTALLIYLSKYIILTHDFCSQIYDTCHISRGLTSYLYTLILRYSTHAVKLGYDIMKGTEYCHYKHVLC